MSRIKGFFAVLLALAIVFVSPAATSFATTVNHSDKARDVLEYVNYERKAAGLPPLTWESSLVHYAVIRAGEIMKVWSHTRPNGEASIDYPGVYGENLAYGTDYTAAEVVAGWMNSPGHRANILRPQFTSMAVACLEA